MISSGEVPQPLLRLGLFNHFFFISLTFGGRLRLDLLEVEVPLFMDITKSYIVLYANGIYQGASDTLSDAI